MTGLDARGMPASVQIEAGSLFEAAAAGLEQLHQRGGLVSQLQVTVYEPVSQYKVQPRQLQRWLRSYEAGDSVGVRALKARVRSLLNKNAGNS